LSEFSLKSTCSSKAPNMQHDYTMKEVGRIGLKERESESSSREGEGGQKSVLVLSERKGKDNELFWVQITYRAPKRNYQNALQSNTRIRRVNR